MNNINVNDIREKVDAIDDEILQLFLQRMAISGEIAQYKLDNNLPIVNKSRERSILQRITAESGDFDVYAYRLFSTLFELSKSYQNQICSAPSVLSGQISKAIASAPKFFPQKATIACQGVEGAYSQLACDKLFPQGDIVYLRTFEGVFDAVDSGLCQFGVLPIENSSNGLVKQVFDLMQRKKFSIVRSIKLCIHHQLLAKPGTKFEDIEEIYSHEQAFGQCSNYIKTLGEQVKVIPCANTAIAAQYAAQSIDGKVAAISSNYCAELYGLTVLSDDIQNSDNNYTRFICISKEMIIYPGANRISLIISCKNYPGALFELIAKFASLNVNLSKLESYPILGHDFEYLFYIDLEASVLQDKIMDMLEDLRRSSVIFIFLGNYMEI